MQAAFTGNSGVVTKLKSLGAPVNTQNNVSHHPSQTVLPASQFFCCITQRGNSALILAARGGHVQVVVELMKDKASLNLQNKV